MIFLKKESKECDIDWYDSFNKLYHFKIWTF